MNNINLVGRLTNDPTFKVTSNALNITTFRLAVKNSRNSSVLFINVVCFDKLANNTFKYLQKATMVAVSGRLDMFEKAPVGSVERLAVIAEAVERLIAPDAVRKDFLAAERLMMFNS